MIFFTDDRQLVETSLELVKMARWPDPARARLTRVRDVAVGRACGYRSMLLLPCADWPHPMVLFMADKA